MTTNEPEKLDNEMESKMTTSEPKKLDDEKNYYNYIKSTEYNYIKSTLEGMRSIKLKNKKSRIEMRKKIALFACQFTETALDTIPVEEEDPRKAIAEMRSWISRDADASLGFNMDSFFIHSGNSIRSAGRMEDKIYDSLDEKNNEKADEASLANCACYAAAYTSLIPTRSTFISALKDAIEVAQYVFLAKKGFQKIHMDITNEVLYGFVNN